MKKNRLLIMMQTVSIVPLLLFTLFYVRESAYVWISGVVSLLWFYNLYQYRNKKALIHYPLWLLLMGSFFFYASYQLGSSQTPQLFERIMKNENQTISFTFAKPTPIDKVCFFIGINQNIQFHLDAKSQDQWQTLYRYEKNFPYSFKWSCTQVDMTTRHVRLVRTQGAMMLNEVKFFSQGKVQFYTTEHTHLNDEQQIEVDESYYGSMYFDEIYHGRTAFEILRHVKTYENTHPYLGKLLLIPGIQLFGMTPLGWRFMTVAFSTLFIGAMYYFALLIWRKRLYAFVASLLLTYSFMHFTQSRMASIDIFGVFFVFLSYLFLYLFIQKQKLRILLLSGVFFGLASAVKWSAVFAALGLLGIALYLLFSHYPLQKKFAGYKLLLYGLLSYAVVAPLVYLLTFYDLYLHTGTLQSIIDYQINMYNYHSQLIASHPYSSPWWSWPLDVKPMCYYRESDELLRRSITAFGNPAIFWAGTLSILYLIYRFFHTKQLAMVFIVLAFAGLYLPYALVGRLMFIYHFYYAVPFMILAIVYAIKESHKQFHFSANYMTYYLCAMVALFLLFYPVLSGYEIPKWYVTFLLQWFPGWWL